MGRPTYLRVDLDALRHNLDVVTTRVGGGIRVMPVVKANGYGHGAVAVAHNLERWGVNAFCVATCDEGVELRQGGITEPILVMGGIYSGEGIKAAAYRLMVAVYSLQNIDETTAEARAAGAGLEVHLKVETGMNRLGVRPEAVGQAARRILDSGCLKPVGIYSHIADAGTEFSVHTTAQIARFEEALGELARAGVQPEWVHMAASGGILSSRGGYGLFGGCRPGIVMYGSVPDLSLKAGAGLRPVATLSTRIIQLRRLTAGERISYGGTYVTRGDTVTAVLPAGYEDGIPRLLSNKGEVLVHGQRAPILGRVCMDMTIVDVTRIPGVKVGDEAVFFGIQDGHVLDVDEVAEKVGTISYEILTAVGNRAPRVYVGGGVPAGLEFGRDVYPES